MSKVLAPEALALVVRSINDLAEAGKWEDVPALINGILASHNELHAETARLREALAWYADPENTWQCADEFWDDWQQDHIAIARAALAGEDVVTK